MEKFLNKDGLEHVWENIEEYIKNNPGRDGKSAYEIAVSLGYNGTEEEWIASLKGETGSQGPSGVFPDPLPIDKGGTGGQTSDDAMKGLIAGMTAGVTGSHTSSDVFFPWIDTNDTRPQTVGRMAFTTVTSWTNNRTNRADAANTSYTTYMGRAIALVSSSPASMTNGTVAFIYV